MLLDTCTVASDMVRTACVAGLFRYSFIFATASGSAVLRAARTFATISASRWGDANACVHRDWSLTIYLLLTTAQCCCYSTPSGLACLRTERCKHQSRSSCRSRPQGCEGGMQRNDCTPARAAAW